MRILALLAACAGLAGAQCYSFSAPGVTYSMNIMGTISSQNTSELTNLIVQQQSVLVVGGKTYTGPVGPGNVAFSSEGGETLYSSAAVSLLSAPVWQVDIFLVGMVTLAPGAPPASLPPVSSWQASPPELEYSIGGGDAIKLTITAIGGCAAGSGGGSGGSGSGSSSTVPGPSLGDPSSQVWCPVCGVTPDPIDLGTGNMFERVEDYRTFGPNRLAFTRYYNSLTAAATLASSLGKNWRSNYDRYLDISSSSVIAERADGQQVTFTLKAGAWTTDTDIDMTLVNSGSTWTLTDHNDTVETYTAVSASEGLLQTIQARNGYTQTLQYNSNNQVTSVTDSYHRQSTFAYSNGLLQSVTTPDGLVLTYSFSASSNVLTSVSYSTTPVTTKTYLYENTSLPAALTGIIDENGMRYMTWTYDSQGRALTSQSGSGADLTTIVYNDTDGSRMVTNALGEQVLYKFATLQGIPKVTEADRIAAAGITAATSVYTYDSNGYMVSETDWNGNETTFVNNSRGEPISINEAVGTPLARTTNIAYHSTFRLPIQVVTPGATIKLTYDPAGELLTQTLIDTTTTTVPYSTGGQTRTWTFTWSNFLPASVQGPRTDVAELSKFAYDSSGALTSITNALNQTTQIISHLPGGLPQTVIDANGVTTNLSYDARQRLLSAALTTSAGVLTTTFAYDAAGNLVTKTWPDGSSFTNRYDAAHRLTELADKLGNSITYTLDALGDRTQVTAADPSGNAQFKRSAVFDALGRLLKMTGGANQVTTLAYDANGNVLTVTDPLNHGSQQSFDVLNRKVKATDRANGVSTVTYDAHDRPTGITDPNGATTTYAYDGFGDLIQQVSPAAGTTTYRADAAGNIVQKTDARGVITNFAYDALDRVISETYPGNPAENVTYNYDESGHGFGVGRLTSVTDAIGALSRSYDERGDLLSETRTRGNATLITAYTYDAASRLASVAYPSKWSVAYARDSAGRISGVTAQPPGGAPQSIVSSLTYQPFGPLSGLAYGNGIAEKRTLDADYRLTGITSANVQNLTYNYDADHNVLGVTDGLNAANSQSLGYDVLNRLTSASGPYSKLAYGYDANSNRISETSPATSDGLSSVAALTYNQAGRLGAVFSGSQQLTQYAYDGFGQRVVKVGSITGTTLYQYGAGGNLLEESDGQGNAQVDYIYLGGRPIATIQGNGSIYFLHDDRLGTPQAATGSTQSVAWSATYQPFGQVSNAPTAIAQDLRLPGQESDLETGLYHNGFRDYVPAWGAYQKSDPIGLMGGMNTYAYAGGNPLRFTDPFGLDCPLGQFASDLFNYATSTANASIDNAAVNFLSQLNSATASAESAAANAWVNTLSQFNSATASAESGAADAWVNTLSLFNFGVANTEANLANSWANLAQTYAAGSSEFGDLGIVLDANLIPTSADLILTGADVSWESLVKAVEVDGSAGATMSVAAVLSLIGIAVDVGEAPSGQKGTTLVVSGAAGVFGFAAATLVTLVEGPAIVVGGGAALLGYGVNKGVKALGQLTFHTAN